MADRPKDIPEALWEDRGTLDIACMPVGGRELVCRAILAERGRNEALRVRVAHALYGEGNDPGNSLEDVVAALIALARSLVNRSLPHG